MHVEIALLGPFCVRVDGSRVPDGAWSRRDSASLVRLLATSPGRRLHREQVVDRLWPDLDLVEAAPRLHKAAHYARRALDRHDAVVLRDDMVSLLPDHEVTVDLHSFEAAAAPVLRSGSRHAAEALLDSYSGEPVADEVYADWAGEVRDRVSVLRRRLMRQALRWHDILTMDPLDEEAREALRHEGPTGAEPVEQQIRFCTAADGVTLAYACSGHGPSLVKAANWLTHVDLDWHSPVWRHWLVELSRRHRLVRYDERGCGLSDREPHEVTFESWVSDLEAVVDAAGLSTFPLLGISQGASVAVTYAARHPERVTHLVLYGGYVQGRLVRARDDEARRTHALQVELARLGWGTDDPALRQVFTAQFMPDGSRELWDSFNELQRQTATPEQAARVLTLTGSIDVSEEATQVRAPTLVLHARHDQRPPFEQGRMLATLIPDSRFVALESKNHILLGDEPAWPRFLAEVEDFLADA